jgi:hypothetical protein
VTQSFKRREGDLLEFLVSHKLLVSVQDGDVEVCIMVASATGKSDNKK